MIDLSHFLTPHFTLAELLQSETAERQPALVSQQENPPAAVLEALANLAATVLEPIRREIGFPLRVSSGYRCPEVNRLVGGVPKSQHIKGEAADLHLQLPDGPLGSSSSEIRQAIAHTLGRALRPDISADFLLFAWVAQRLEHLKVDQLIHEWGLGAGRPAWVHVSTPLRGEPRGEILIIGRTGTSELSVRRALALGGVPEAG